MRLDTFILTHREQILTEWETFARTCAPASITMDVEALRDHANVMLTAIAADLATYQNAHEQSEKSKGLAPDTGASTATAAEEHGAGRAESGFTVEQMVSEYRALRASVLRLWTREKGELGSADIQDLIRFNEAIDQSLAESVVEFAETVEEAKEMFLAILGHDLRTPLGAIDTSARFVLETAELADPQRKLMSRIVDSASRMRFMVVDLLDFARSRLGGGIPLERAETHLGNVLSDVVGEVMAAYPDRKVEIDIREEQVGAWDTARISQVLTNLVSNAVEHGSPGTAVTIELRGNEENAAITIRNRGTVIPANRLNGIFNPMKVSSTTSTRGGGGNLGLGLYIAERIVHAHRGRIEVESTEAGGTNFTVHLPRLENRKDGPESLGHLAE